MNITKSVTICLTKYFNFDGNASRSEFWWFTLFYLTLSLLGRTLDGNLSASGLNIGFWESLISLLLIIPYLAVTCRRLHDIGRSGWWQLIGFTIIGLIPLIYWWCSPSVVSTTNGNNSAIDSNIKKYLVLPIASIFIFLSILGLLTETSIMPNTYVQKGIELSEGDKIQLLNNNIINRGDKILFFYSEGLFSILEGGQVLTDDRIISYERNEAGRLGIYELKFKDVKKVILEDRGSFFSDSIYRIEGNNDDYLIIFLSTMYNKDKDFINKLYEKIY